MSWSFSRNSLVGDVCTLHLFRQLQSSAGLSLLSMLELDEERQTTNQQPSFRSLRIDGRGNRRKQGWKGRLGFSLPGRIWAAVDVGFGTGGKAWRRVLSPVPAPLVRLWMVIALRSERADIHTWNTCYKTIKVP